MWYNLTKEFQFSNLFLIPKIASFDINHWYFRKNGICTKTLSPKYPSLQRIVKLHTICNCTSLFPIITSLVFHYILLLSNKYILLLFFIYLTLLWIYRLICFLLDEVLIYHFPFLVKIMTKSKLIFLLITTIFPRYV